MEFIVIDGAEHVITLDANENGESVKTAADCVCGESAWTVERRGYCGEDGFLTCDGCGKEYPIQWRRDAAPSLTES